jgi:hypothetical protein
MNSETFNYQLTAAEISRSFNTVKTTDGNLNGVPDLLEDVAWGAPKPFVGVPFVITGTMEAEQFDQGGPGVAYNSFVSTNTTSDYRLSRVDQLRSNDWLSYSVDVRVGQTYAVEVRAAGLGTNGAFRVEFYSNSTMVAHTTNNLTITTTNWATYQYRPVTLTTNVNRLRLVMATNGTDNTYVGKFNYISVYPCWQEGITNELTEVTVTDLGTNDTWLVATNNAARIQNAIDGLPSTGGRVVIPSGTFYVSQEVPDENSGNVIKNALDNTAVFLSKSNVEIMGAGKTQTTIIGHNRATTLLFVGLSGLAFVAVTNLILRDITLEGRPHLVATQLVTLDYTNYYESGALYPGATELGSLAICRGYDASQRTVNVMLTNCLFRNAPFDAISVPGYLSNCLVRNCDFISKEGTNGTFPFPRTNIVRSMLTTSNDPSGTVGFFIRDGAGYNIVMLENTYSGNPAITNANTNYYADAGDGIAWYQAGGNWFFARNIVTNYGLEGISSQGGPLAIVENVSSLRSACSRLAPCTATVL